MLLFRTNDTLKKKIKSVIDCTSNLSPEQLQAETGYWFTVLLAFRVCGSDLKKFDLLFAQENFGFDFASRIFLYINARWLLRNVITSHSLLAEKKNNNTALVEDIGRREE